MSTTHSGPYAAIDESFENATGVDLRLVYGLGVPFLLGVGAIIAFAFFESLWLAVVLTVMLAVVGGGLVVHGLQRMLEEEDSEEAL